MQSEQQSERKSMSRKARMSPGDSTERVVTAILQGIEKGVLVPGQRLVEPDLTSQLKVSRSTLRQAFQRLSAEGVVEIFPNRGARVRLLTADDLYEIQQLRNLLEPFAAALAAKSIKNGDNRDRFRTAVKVWLDEPPVEELESFLMENKKFYQTIIETSGSKELARVLRHLNVPLFAAHFRHIEYKERIALAKYYQSVAKAILAAKPADAKRSVTELRTFSDKLLERRLAQGESGWRPV